MIKEATKYYAWLYRKKVSRGAEQLYEKLRAGNRVTPNMNKSCNKKLNAEDIRRAIRSIQCNQK